MSETSACVWLLLLVGLTALANWQAVETFHHGSLFESLRARLESRRDGISELTGCPFCLGHWSGLLLSALSFTCFAWDKAPLPTWLLFPVFTLAVIRASQWLNDRVASYCRTPNRKAEEPHVEPTESGEQP
jgi:hypothetical protein